MVTHSVDFLEYFDKIIVINKGKIQQIGHYDEMKHNEYVQKVEGIYKSH